MWECDYAREPVDYRLFWLRLLKKIWILPVSALIGFIVIGGIYYMSKLCFGNGRTYQAESMYYLDFAAGVDGTEYTYLNKYTWGEVVKTDFFMDRLTDFDKGAHEREYIEASLYAGIESDVRYLYTRCTSRDRDFALATEKALEEIMEAFGNDQKEFNEIRVVKAASDVKDVSNIRLLTAALLGAAVGLFASIIILLAKEITDTSISIPATLEKRYHVATLGAPSMEEYEANCKSLLAGLTPLYLVPGDDKTEATDVELYVNHTPCKNPVKNPSAIDVLKGAGHVVVAVKADAHNGKRLERTLEELGRIGAHVDFFVLTGEDSKLIKKYYKN